MPSRYGATSPSSYSEHRPRDLWLSMEDSESAVSLAVVGAEGAGKSTLIASMLGLETVPIEADQAGTLAPTLIHWFDDQSPRYELLLLGSERRIRCENREQFCRFILHRHNPGNQYGIGLGIVGLRNELLLKGLVLLDMPGVGGLLDGMHQTTRDWLQKAQAVIAVLRDRTGYGQVVPLIKELTQCGSMLEAFVNNVSVEEWPVRDRSGFIAERKRTVRSNLARRGVMLPEAAVFILHLPSVLGLEPAPEPWINDPAHATEIQRFRHWLTGYVSAAAPRPLPLWTRRS